MISGDSTEPGRPSESVRQAGAQPELASTEVAMGRPSTEDVVIEGATEFIGATRFECEKQGYLFKWGDKGMGYYKDPRFE